MLNIKYKGKYKSEEQLKEGFEQLPYSGIYREIPKARIIFFHYIVPLILLGVVTVASIMYQIILARNVELLNDLIALINDNMLIVIYLVSLISIYLVLSFIHELIHCIFYPLKAEKQIYSRLPYGLMVHCGAQISKGRFIFMVLAPCLILGIIPFLLCTAVVWRFNPHLSLYCTVLSSALISSSCADLISAYKTITQVPNGAKVFNYGIETYWIED